MKTHRWIRFSVSGMTLFEIEMQAAVELERLTGIKGLPFNAEVEGHSIDTSGPSGISSVLAGYRAEIKAVVERES